jgi:glucose/arabinose dehydrogenase
MLIRMGRSVVLALLASFATATPCAPQIASQVVATGLHDPVAVVADPTQRSTFFVVQQGGLVRVVREGMVHEQPFLDLRSEIANGGERGLLGLVLAPDYAESRRFFVNFTNRNGDTVVARFRRHVDDSLRADPESRFDLQWPNGRRVIDQPFSNHNGGYLAFGPGGYLFIGLGDGGSGGDPMNLAQSPDSLLGKMLRIDVNVSDEDSRGYRVPADNPFVDGRPVRALAEVWAFGLRNPWRYSFDDWTRGGTSALTIADVGQDSREEVNFEPSGRGGRNYGWRIREGREPFDARTRPAYLPLTEPIYDYGRAVGGSITGGLIYRGEALDPSLNGRYFYGDFVSGRLFSIALDLDPTTGEARADDEREHTESLGGETQLGMISSFGTDHDGELLVLNYARGSLIRIVPDFSAVPRPPQLTAEFDDARLFATWTPEAEGVAPLSYSLERVRDGIVTDRQPLTETAAEVLGTSGDCMQVRGVARDGLKGPPSVRVCFP